MTWNDDCPCPECVERRGKPRVITMNCEMPSLGLSGEDYAKALVYPLAIEPLPKYERPEGLYRPDPPVPEIPSSRPTDAIDESHGPLVQVLMKQVRDLEQQNSALQQSNNQLLERARRAEALNREYQSRFSNNSA